MIGAVRAAGGPRDLEGRSRAAFEAIVSMRDFGGQKDSDVDGTTGQAGLFNWTEDQFRGLLDSAPDAMVIVDANRKIVLVNRQTELLFGYTREVLLGRPVEVLIPARFRDRHHLLADGYLEAPEVRAMGPGRELLGLRADGSEVPVEISLSPIETETGVLVCAAVRDVTDLKLAEDKLKVMASIVESSDDAILVRTLDDTITEWNEGAEHIYGYMAAEVIGRRSASILAAPDRPDEVPAILGRIARGESVEPYETVRRRKDGALVDVSIKASAVRDAQGRIVGIATVARDISAARRAREDLAAAHRELSRHVEELERRNRHLVLVNAMADLLGSIESEAEAYQIAGDYGAELFPSVSGAIFLSNPLGTLLEAVVSWGDAIQGERVFPPADCWAIRQGRVCGRPGAHNAPRCRHIQESVAAYLCIPLLAQGRSIGVLHLAASAPDADEANPEFGQSAEALAVTFMENLALALSNFRLRELLRVQSIRDPLTGLFNRRYMEESLERELTRATRNHRPLGLLMIDIDNFKNWNDTYGHEAGDALLREVARLMEHQTRGEDIVSRFGGDEFLVALPEASLETTTRRGRDLCRAVHEMEIRHLGQTLGKATVTIGVAAHPENGDDKLSLIRAADEAMYRGKRAGRNNVELSPTPLDLTESGATGPTATITESAQTPNPAFDAGPGPAGREVDGLQRARGAAPGSEVELPSSSGGGEV